MIPAFQGCEETPDDFTKVLDEEDNGYACLHAYVWYAIEIDLHLAPEPASVSEARHALDELGALLPTQALDNLRLLVSELVTNSVRHAGLEPTDLISLKVSSSTGPVRVQVADHGPGFEPPPFEPPPASESEVNGVGGRGLYLVDMLADRWGVEREDGVSRVWVEVGPDTGAG